MTRTSVLRVWLLIPLLGSVHTRLSAQEVPDTLTVVLRAHAGVFVSGSQTEPQGFDVDLLRRFVAWQKSRTGRDLAFRATFVDTIPALLDAAREGRCDLAVGSVTATPERDEIVDFSDIYLPVRMVAIAPAGRLAGGSYQQVLAGKRVGALRGSTHAAFLADLEKEVADLSAKTDYATADGLFAACLGETPEVDAVVTDLTHYWYLKQKENVVLVATFGQEQGVAFVFPAGSALRESVNAFLKEFLHSASYFTLVRQHFGEEAAQMIRSARKK